MRAAFSDKLVAIPGNVAELADGKRAVAETVRGFGRLDVFVGNVEVEPGESAAEVKVYCNFLVYRSRAETEQDCYVGTRQNVLRWEGGA